MKNLGPNWNGTETYVKEEDGFLYTSDVLNAKTVQSILDQNARHRAMGRRPNSQARGRMVASVPTPIHYMWRKEWKQKYSDKWTWQTYVAMKLNAREYAYLRTTEGKV